jgi:peptide chain release factor 3
VRIVSGKYEKGMKVLHSRSKKLLTLSQASKLFATERDEVIEAFPGDIIGINNPAALFSIGDAIYTGLDTVRFKGMPSFSPEIFAYLKNTTPSKYKNYRKGLRELIEEGAINLLRDRFDDGTGSPILAAVGQLQFDVVKYRLENEYGVQTAMEALGYSIARWANGGWPSVDKAIEGGKIFGAYVAKDRWDRPVLLFRNKWKVDQLLETETEHGLGLFPCASSPSD